MTNSCQTGSDSHNLQLRGFCKQAIDSINIPLLWGHNCQTAGHWPSLGWGVAGPARWPGHCAPPHGGPCLPFRGGSGMGGWRGGTQPLMQEGVFCRQVADINIKIQCSSPKTHNLYVNISSWCRTASAWTCPHTRTRAHTQAARLVNRVLHYRSSIITNNNINQ